jgi:hypothetical protein
MPLISAEKRENQQRNSIFGPDLLATDINAHVNSVTFVVAIHGCLERLVFGSLKEKKLAVSGRGAD